MITFRRMLSRGRWSSASQTGIPSVSYSATPPVRHRSSSARPMMNVPC